MLFADRLYGIGRFIHDVITAAGARCQVLIHVGKAFKPKVLKVLSDGSAALEALLPLLSLAGDIISPAQCEKIIIKFMAHTAREAL